jgi:RNA polymerase sigma-70 factor (ECF subfamily)
MEPESADATARRILEQYGDMLVRVAAGYTDNPLDRDDLVQEILIALWRAMPSFRGKSSEKTFILRIAHNRGISYSVRHKRRATDAPLDAITDPRPDAEASLVARQEHDHLLSMIRRLPEHHRQAVMLQLEGLSRSEIAQIQGTTENNVGVRLTRAQHALRALLSKNAP